MTLSAPKLATHLQATLNTPGLIVLGVGHRNGLTVLDFTTPDQRHTVDEPLHYWHQIKTTCHLREYALWDATRMNLPTRNDANVMSTLTLVKGKRIEVKWESTLQYVNVKRIHEQPKIITLAIPRERALMLIAA